MIFKSIYKFGDRLEDRVRGKLSHYPLVYAFVGGTGVIIFWRGIWHSVDYLMEYFFVSNNSVSSTSVAGLPWWDGPLSILIGMLLLLVVGLFVSSFIGNEIIISGLKGEKKIVEKTEEEVKAEVQFDIIMKKEIHEIGCRLNNIEEVLNKK